MLASSPEGQQRRGPELIRPKSKKGLKRPLMTCNAGGAEHTSSQTAKVFDGQANPALEVHIIPNVQIAFEPPQN